LLRDRLLPIKWLGHRRIDCARHPDPDQVWPIRIIAGAFGSGRPFRDLLLSPDHALFIDGVLIPARLLVNGASIAPDPSLAAVDYHHLEFDRHTVLYAEGVAAESYLDTGNRAQFSGGAVCTLHPDLSTHGAPKTWERDACAPLALDAARVRPIWQRLADRAGALGFHASTSVTTMDHALQAVAAGRIVRSVVTAPGRHVFALPPGCASVCLHSRAASPADTQPWLEDRRRLGVCVGRIRVGVGADMHELPVDHPSMTEGWWDAERSSDGLWRWTDGAALLPLPFAAEALEVQLIGEMTYRLDTGAALRTAA